MPVELDRNARFFHWVFIGGVHPSSFSGGVQRNFLPVLVAGRSKGLLGGIYVRLCKEQVQVANLPQADVAVGDYRKGRAFVRKRADPTSRKEVDDGDQFTGEPEIPLRDCPQLMMDAIEYRGREKVGIIKDEVARHERKSSMPIGAVEERIPIEYRRETCKQFRIVILRRGSATACL